MPAKAVLSDKWFIRVDGPMEFLKEKIKLVKMWLDLETIGIGYHLGSKKDNPHCHMVIKMKKEIQQQSMVVRIKTLFDVKSKSQYSCVPWDGKLQCYSYLFHEGETDVDLTKTELSESEMTEVKTMVKVYKEIVVEAKQKASHKIVDHMLEYIKQRHEYLSKWQIGMEMMHLHRQGLFYLPKQKAHMISFIDEIYLKQYPDNALGNKADKAYLTSLFEQFYRHESVHATLDDACITHV